jgi:F-type H+-transporting ATPase subunit epsilon
MTKFMLEMLTPERTFFKGKVDSIIVQSLDGSLGILAGHSPMVIGLEPSMITIKNDGETKICANGEGFLQVRPDETIILCQTMEWPEEIELNRVNRAIEEHERKLREAKSIAEYKLSKATLSRAFARLRVKSR